MCHPSTPQHQANFGLITGGIFDLTHWGSSVLWGLMSRWTGSIPIPSFQCQQSSSFCVPFRFKFLSSPKHDPQIMENCWYFDSTSSKSTGEHWCMGWVIISPKWSSWRIDAPPNADLTWGPIKSLTSSDTANWNYNSLPSSQLHRNLITIDCAVSTINLMICLWTKQSNISCW